MRFRRPLLTLLSAFSLMALAAFSFGQEMLYLSPDHDLAGYTHINWSHDAPPDIVLVADGVVPIAKCVIPDKTDVLISVEVNGHAYFVGSGYYTVLRRRATPSEAWLNPRATASCKGMFRVVSEQAPNNSFKPKPLRGSA